MPPPATVSLGIGLDIWDAQHRLVLHTAQDDLLHLGVFAPRQTEPFQSGALAAQRQRGADSAVSEPCVSRYEVRTSDGLLVQLQLDLTEVVRRCQALERRCAHLAQLSSTDELTGLVNRRHFDKVLASEWARALRSGTSVGFLMIDIDHFKNFNDHYGHAAGDECLRRVANALARSVRRAGELVARYGGEEFVVLLPRADLAHSHETALRCLEEVQREAIEHLALASGAHVTVSIGMACAVPDGMEELETMVEAADVAMYRAKTAGRARVVLASQADWEMDKDTPRTQPAPLC
jgi:diguanylate cyclase (GGDEF)-like protein